MSNSQENEYNLSNLGDSCAMRVYLQTLIVKIRGKNRDYFIRTIIDSGSSHSYITKFIAKKLRLKSEGNEEITHSLFCGIEKKLSHEKYSIVLKNINDNFSCTLKLRDQEQICSNIQKIENPEVIKQLKRQGIVLSDLEVGGGRLPVRQRSP